MPRLNVSPPSFDPSPYGLLSVVEARYDEADPHWRSGVQWQPLCGDLATTYDPCLAVTGTGGPPPFPPGKDSSLTYETRGATPFSVYALFNCSPAAAAEEAQRQAQEAMKRLESWQVERSFWTGMAGGETVVFPHLAADAEVRDVYDILLQTAADPVTGAAVNIVEAFGQIEKALADCFNGAGVIHVPAELGAAIANASLAKPEGRRLKTLNGNWVVIGNGYPGTSPAGTAPADGTAWIYGTGPIFAYRSRVWVPDLPSIVNRSNNTVEALAERTYVLGYDCCLVAALVDVGGET